MFCARSPHKSLSERLTQDAHQVGNTCTASHTADAWTEEGCTSGNQPSQEELGRQGADCPQRQILWPVGNRKLLGTASCSPGTSSGCSSKWSFKSLRKREMEWGDMMLIALDRGTESDYRSTILPVTLYLEKNLASLNARLYCFSYSISRQQWMSLN